VVEEGYKMIKILQGDFGVVDRMQSKLRPIVVSIPVMQFMIPLKSNWLMTSITVIPSLLSGMESGTKNLGLERRKNFHTNHLLRSLLTGKLRLL
jgi:hypothetical protein